jgi:hypothetical protein
MVLILLCRITASSVFVTSVEDRQALKILFIYIVFLATLLSITFREVWSSCLPRDAMDGLICGSIPFHPDSLRSLILCLREPVVEQEEHAQQILSPLSCGRRHFYIPERPVDLLAMSTADLRFDRLGFVPPRRQW